MRVHVRARVRVRVRVRVRMRVRVHVHVRVRVLNWDGEQEADPTFYAAKKFAGKKVGFVFKTGSEGLGSVSPPSFPPLLFHCVILFLVSSQ